MDPEAEITIKEWDKLWTEFDPKHMHIWQWEYLKYMFFLLDKSGDKYIDVEEYQGCHGHLRDDQGGRRQSIQTVCHRQFPIPYLLTSLSISVTDWITL